MFHAELPAVSQDWSDPKAVLLALTHALVAAAPGESGSLHGSSAANWMWSVWSGYGAASALV